MNTEFRRLPREDFRDFINIVVNAYTGVFPSTVENKKLMEQTFIKFQDEEPTINYYGAYRNEELVGGMRLHEFVMNVLSQRTQAGGIGLVAVDFLHKKEKICKDIICYSIDYFKKKGYGLAMLYPFRPDFYKKMGFGYGTKINQYRVKPEHLPIGNSKEHIRFASIDDKENLRECYNRYIHNINGMIEKSDYALNRIFDTQNRVVVCQFDSLIRGYTVFKFEQVNANNLLINDIHIDELVYENKEVLKELLTFLNSQSDQIREIIFDTQDEFFHHLLSDVRSRSTDLIPHVFHESNVQGVGIMYRVINTKKVFETLSNHNFGGQTCKLKLTVHDSLLEENNGSTLIYFESGTVKLVAEGESDVEISMDVSDFSSMLIGVISFKSLYRYGLGNISDEKYIETVNKIFATDEKPMCTAKF